jgi:hypothetical protein
VGLPRLAYHSGVPSGSEQEDKLWEWRTTASLARLRRDRRTEARDLFAPVYGWFAEGFDMPDLKEAKVLLGELAEASSHAAAYSSPLSLACPSRWRGRPVPALHRARHFATRWRHRGVA